MVYWSYRKADTGRGRFMKLKRIDAVAGLLSVIALLVHIGYTAYAYLAFYYNPTLKLLTAVPFMVLACLHAVLGMSAVFLQGDGTRLDLYPKQNLRTIVQRIAAALILPLLILHLNTYSLLRTCAEGGKWFFFALLMISQPLFYGTVLTHIASSVTRGMITLGWITDRDKQKRLDRIVYTIAAIAFAVVAFAVVKGELAMFLPTGGTD